MKICSLVIKGFQQFEDTFLDFTHPETGEPLNKICFIGRNGTGKSTIIKLINDFLIKVKDIGASLVILKVNYNDDYFYTLYSNILYKNTGAGIILKNSPIYFKEEVEKAPNWMELIQNPLNKEKIQNAIDSLKPYLYQGDELNSLLEKIKLKENSSDLLIFSPSESATNVYLSISDVPTTTLNEALVFFDKLPYHHIVSDQNVQDFWKMLVYLIKKRDAEQQEFENRPENLTKTKQQLLNEFENISPKILEKLADLWNKILANAGLEFDVENSSNPIHLNDNLKAYIVLKGTKQRINYNQLSTGIRNYIFRIGHIFTLYFNRSIENGFLLLDEPENSLFPDFLFELMETYETLVLDKDGVNNTQIFMTTHNPIVAAQFEPWERIILEWETDGTVKAFKGRTPVGDDPNDILKNDFGLQNLMGKKGIEVWNEYLDLKKELRKSQNGNKEMLVDKITKIGSAYNFE